MVMLADLWLPILLSAVFVFVASCVMHMAIPIHKSDFGPLPNEAKVLEALRAQGVTPGDYMFPRGECMADMGKPEMIEKFRKGPVGTMTVRPNGMPSIGKSLMQWFLFSILVSVIAGYVGTLGLTRSAGYPQVFRLVGTAAILGYAFADFPTSIWKGQRWSTTFKFAFDGVVYGLVTGGTFGWLWPHLV